MDDAHGPSLIPPPADHHAAPILVGFSGGLDSTVLLHLLAEDALVRRQGLRAAHVHHGLHPDADRWAAHCAEICAAIGVAFECVHVDVDHDAGHGLEGAARHARHAAFARLLREGEILALAHHRDDQAETFLMRALRASGTDGLAAMRPWRAFGAGWIWRPLLATPRATLEAVARSAGLRWVEDPSNADPTPDRNFLRLEVLPLLRRRWPQVDAAFARSAELSAESVELLEQQDLWSLNRVREETGSGLSAEALRSLTPPRRARVLRYWVSRLGWPPLPSEGIARIEQDLLGEPSDRLPGFGWRDVEIRRWREGLYAIDHRHSLPRDWSQSWDGRAPLTLPNGDVLTLIGAAAFPAPVVVHARRGGERIRLPDRDHHHPLKNILQEADVPPWDRERMPLLSTDDETLLAAGDSIASDIFEDWLLQHGARLEWTRS